MTDCDIINIYFEYICSIMKWRYPHLGCYINDRQQIYTRMLHVYDRSIITTAIDDSIIVHVDILLNKSIVVGELSLTDPNAEDKIISMIVGASYINCQYNASLVTCASWMVYIPTYSILDLFEVFGVKANGYNIDRNGFVTPTRETVHIINNFEIFEVLRFVFPPWNDRGLIGHYTRIDNAIRVNEKFENIIKYAKKGFVYDRRIDMLGGLRCLIKWKRDIDSLNSIEMDWSNYMLNA